jgi:hypothetical protein
METTTNPARRYTTRMDELAEIAGLSLTPAEYTIRSTSTISGETNVIGWTDCPAKACAAADMLQAHKVPCETIGAHVG